MSPVRDFRSAPVPAVLASSPGRKLLRGNLEQPLHLLLPWVRWLWVSYEPLTHNPAFAILPPDSARFYERPTTTHQSAGRLTPARHSWHNAGGRAGGEAGEIGPHREAAQREAGARPHRAGHPPGFRGGAPQAPAVPGPGPPGDPDYRGFHRAYRRSLRPVRNAAHAQRGADKGECRYLRRSAQPHTGPLADHRAVQQRVAGAPR